MTLPAQTAYQPGTGLPKFFVPGPLTIDLEWGTNWNTLEKDLIPGGCLYVREGNPQVHSLLSTCKKGKVPNATRLGDLIVVPGHDAVHAAVQLGRLATEFPDFG